MRGIFCHRGGVMSRSFKGAACLLCLGAVEICWSHPALSQQRTIEVSWIEVHDEISPRQVVSRHSRLLKFNLEDDNTIVTSARTFRHNEQQITRNGTGLTRWRFDAPNTLVREQLAPGYIRRVTVQIDHGGFSCQARISLVPEGEPLPNESKLRWDRRGAVSSICCRRECRLQSNRPCWSLTDPGRRSRFFKTTLNPRETLSAATCDLPHTRNVGHVRVSRIRVRRTSGHASSDPKCHTQRKSLCQDQASYSGADFEC